MKIKKLSKFRENIRLYSILSFVSISVLLIILIVLAVLFNDSRRNVIIRAIFITLVFDVIALEFMLEGLTIRLNKYIYNDNEYILYAGVFNTYLFINGSEAMNKYDINCFSKCKINYLNAEELVEIELSAIRNCVICKIDGNKIESIK